MARKKRTPEATLPVNEPKESVQYQDAFQQTLTKGFDEFGKRVEGKGRTALYAIGAIAVALVLIGIIYLWMRNSDAKAQFALGKAIETSQASVSDQPLPAGSTIKSFKTEKERAEASVTEFQAVADKFGGAVGEKAKYFVAVNKLSLDRAAATTELDALSKGSGEVGTLAKFALAQVKAADGKNDEAIAIYQQLASGAGDIVPKDTVNLELGKLLEKTGKKDDAVNVYFTMVKAASEAKDLDGKAVPLSQTITEAKEKLKTLSPEKAKEIPEPKPELPAGAGQLPLGMQ